MTDDDRAELALLRSERVRLRSALYRYSAAGLIDNSGQCRSGGRARLVSPVWDRESRAKAMKAMLIHVDDKLDAFLERHCE